MSMLVRSEQRTPLFNAAVALLLALAALVVTDVMTTAFNIQLPYLPSFAAVAVSAWYCGTRPAVLTAISSFLLVNFVVIEPRGAFALDPTDLVGGLMFLAVAALIIWTDMNRRETAQALKEARDELQIILDGVADGITVQTEDGQPIFANNAAATLLRYRTPAELTADSHEGRARRYTLLDDTGDPVPMSSRPRSQVFRTGAAAAMSFQVRFNDIGDIRWIHLKSSPVFDSRRRTKVAVNILQDITASKTHEFEMARINDVAEASRKRLDRLITHVPGMVYDGVLDPATGEQRLEFVSPYTEKLFGFDIERIQNDPKVWQEIIHPDDRQRLVDDIQAQLKNGDSVRVTFRAIRADEHVIYCEASFALTRDDAGNPIGTAGVVVDITERKETEAALVQYANELQRSNEELEQFAYVASHDLQEPLRMVASYLQLLEQRYVTQLDADAKDFIDYAVDGANRMKTLINDLLTYSRVQRAKLVMGKVSLETIVEQAKANLRVAIEDSGAVITCSNLPSVTAHEGQLVQLIQNFIANAIKFKREIPPRIDIAAEQDPDEWVISVKDNGIGIDERFLERIFVIFQRLHGREQYPGTGIGLAICKKIVERHNGRIWVESKVGIGTTFYFTIPVMMKKVLNGSR